MPPSEWRRTAARGWSGGSRYCAPPPFALDRLKQVEGQNEVLVYHCPKPCPTGKRSFVIAPPRIHRHKAKLANEKMSSLVHLQVDTDSNGAVVLSGKVRTQEEADKAVAIARETEGVTSVKSNIHIEKDD
jgi:hypothetical protein